MKDELGGKTMKECFGLRTKTYSYLVDDGSEDISKQKVKQMRHKKKT